VTTVPPRRGRVAVVGAGPAGMATALSVHQTGHGVTLLERYPQARPAGNSFRTSSVLDVSRAGVSEGTRPVSPCHLHGLDTAPPHPRIGL
jgi:NADPH-dependent 2,4-dienoyl-CoA reductase/sulfur reductase-like enzyme